MIETKWCSRSVVSYQDNQTMFTKREGKGMVFEIVFKVLLVSQSYYLNQEAVINFIVDICLSI